MKTSRRFMASMLTMAVPLLLASGKAYAEWDPVMHRSDAGVDLYAWSARGVGLPIAAVPFVQFEPTPDLFINLRFPATLWINGPRNRAYAALGNPTFSIWYSDIADKLTWYVGGRASAPLASIDDNNWRYTNTFAAFAMGLYDAYLWVPTRLPLGGLGGIEYRFADFFVLRAGGDVIFYVPIARAQSDYRLRGREFDAVIQTKVEGEFQSDSGAGGGLALMGIWIPTAFGDNAQTLALPYFVYDSQKTFFMRAGLLIALDRPLGPGFDRGGVFSLYLQFGGHID